jgi:3-phenylpropionate/cinnamic acid dioxygenase small subunit
MLPELQQAILDLNARYAQTIDDGRLEDWPAFFTETARYVVTTAENFERGLPLGIIYATSRAMLRDRVRSLREANVYEAQRYRHIVGLPPPAR